MPPEPRRRVCFVTGTRAEFGLMASTLRALRDDPRLAPQLVATGAHTHARRGATLNAMRRDGWTVDRVVPWADDTRPAAIARQTGLATAGLAKAFDELRPDVVMVVGDRVEAFAAATAANLRGTIVAHVHGGDRALGQVDDALRHAISKLAHVHFCATPDSGDRLFAMGEDRWRIRVVGAPGIDGIHVDALKGSAVRAFLRENGFVAAAGESALLLLHPTDADDRVEAARTDALLDALRGVHHGGVIALMPNSDPGSEGIATVLNRRAAGGGIWLLPHADRRAFLGLMRDCRALIGNSSSGIIEAGSFGTPVLDVGPRQRGRERGPNVRHVDWGSPAPLAAAVARALKAGRTARADNPYDRGGAARRIVRALASLRIDDRLRRKLIRY